MRPINRSEGLHHECWAAACKRNAATRGERGDTHSRTRRPPREHSWHRQLRDASQVLSLLSFLYGVNGIISSHLLLGTSLTRL